MQQLQRVLKQLARLKAIRLQVVVQQLQRVLEQLARLRAIRLQVVVQLLQRALGQLARLGLAGCKLHPAQLIRNVLIRNAESSKARHQEEMQTLAMTEKFLDHAWPPSFLAKK